MMNNPSQPYQQSNILDAATNQYISYLNEKYKTGMPFITIFLNMLPRMITESETSNDSTKYRDMLEDFDKLIVRLKERYDTINSTNNADINE
jgi:hypothetical protein